MGWHIRFGVESGLDALFSPTHLLLFTGAALLFSGPQRDPDQTAVSTDMGSARGHRRHHDHHDHRLRPQLRLRVQPPTRDCTRSATSPKAPRALRHPDPSPGWTRRLSGRYRADCAADFAAADATATVRQCDHRLRHRVGHSRANGAELHPPLGRGGRRCRAGRPSPVAAFAAWAPRVSTATVAAVSLPAILWSAQFVAWQLGPVGRAGHRDGHAVGLDIRGARLCARSQKGMAETTGHRRRIYAAPP
ncbi:Uncharacterised protein [Nocardia asteroides]|nr:hypothetical protein SAMN05444423_1153 [Nocardia asteroides]VEG36433.1 Uncharacterised protein [Nocardia asteroides]